MSTVNRIRPMAFSDAFVEATLIEDVRDHQADGIVVNLSGEPLHVGGPVPGVVPAWKSTILHCGTIVRGARAAVIRVTRATNLGGLVIGNPNWNWFGDRMAAFPRESPLFISRHDIVGEVTLDPYRFANMAANSVVAARYDIRLNLWWAPAMTDAMLHNQHAFLEIHTQIHGLGRIQIFSDPDASTPYREITTAPGDTHDPIVRVMGNRDFSYPWHRGWTDTDAIWLAIELHPKN